MERVRQAICGKESTVTCQSCEGEDTAGRGLEFRPIGKEVFKEVTGEVYLTITELIFGGGICNGD